MGFDCVNIIKSLLDLTPDILNFWIIASDLLISDFLGHCGGFCLILLLLCRCVILFDEVDQLTVILLKLRLRMLKSLLLSSLLFQKPTNLLFNCIIWKFHQKHFLLLINKFSYILWSWFSRKLHSWFGNMHSSTNIASLSCVEIINAIFTLNWSDVWIFDSLEWHSWRCSFLVPNFQMLCCLLCLFLLLLFCLSGYENLLFIWWFEWRVFFRCTSSSSSKEVGLTVLSATLWFVIHYSLFWI